MPELPTGTVTLLFTDIEGSTRLWEQYPETMEPALARHDSLLREAIEANVGHVFKTGGDAFCCVFAEPANAVAAALAAQQSLQAESWDDGVQVNVRMAIHTGPAQEREGDYFGTSVNRVARLLACAYGGQTLLSRATYELVREHAPEAVSFQDLGEHSLRDLSRPEHVFQLCHSDLPSDFPALRSLQAFAHNLPMQLTSFIGRETEIEEVKELLPDTRLLTLTGVGGAGKTRLALQVAAEVLDDCADGVWVTELAHLADPELIPQTMATALGVREQPGQSIEEALTDHLRSKSCLLILDNCEHVLDASARLADHLLRSCSELKVLASSREALGIAGETTYQVLSLSVPDAAEAVTPDGAARYDSVRLFCDRAQSHQPSFEATDANAAAVAQICRRLDGIPLAIELAAARVRAMPVEQIAQRLSDRFRLLTGGSRTALPRQQTLQALIDWSYDLLTDHEKTLLARLSVFAGGWTLEAGEAVCSGDGIEDWEVLDLLTSLVDKSMAAYGEPDGQARYRLLETVRQYARDRLMASGEGAAVRDRHVPFFLALAQKAGQKLFDPAHAEWFKLLESEHDNLRAALDWCQETDDGGEAGLRLATALRWFWSLRGHTREGRDRLNAALAHPRGAPPEVRARALYCAGNFARLLSDFPAARRLHEESVAIWRELGSKAEVANCLSGLANVARIQGDYSEATALYQQSLHMCRQMSDEAGVAAALGWLGVVAWNQEDYETARSLLEESLAMHRRLGDDRRAAMTLDALALVISSQGSHCTAYSMLEESLAILREADARAVGADRLTNMALVAWRQGRFAAALAHLCQCLPFWRESMEGGYTAALGLEILGAVYVAESKAEPAARLFGAAEALREAIGAPMPPPLRHEYERNVAAARDALGDEAFEAAWAAGRAMTMDEAIAYALGEGHVTDEPLSEGPSPAT